LLLLLHTLQIDLVKREALSWPHSLKIDFAFVEEHRGTECSPE
jgi:hypothetical protein